MEMINEYLTILGATLVYGYGCKMPKILQGDWFSWELGRKTDTNIDQTSMSGRGECVVYERKGADYTFVFKDPRVLCFHCVKTFPRTLNVFEKYEGKSR